jgi:hypothetical protein
MKSLLSFGLTVGLLFSAASGAFAFRPHSRPFPPPSHPQPPQQHTAFAGLSALDPSTCSVLGRVMVHPEVLKNFKKAAKSGGELRKITSLPSSRSDEQTIEFQFDKVGNPFGPPTTAIPYHGTFRVQLFLPQDAGWQLGEISPLAEVQ